WRRLFGPLARDAGSLAGELLGPVPHIPRHPLALARFGLPALQSASGLASGRFRDEAARALFTGIAAHSMLDLRRSVSASFGLVLGLYAHAVGWPIIGGGTANLTSALAAELLELGGTIEVDRPIGDLAELPPARAVLLDVTPRAALAIAGDRLPPRTRRAFEAFRYGPGVFKVDWALDGPIPWTASGAARAATVHLGGSMAEIVTSEAEVAAGRHPDTPFTLLCQYLPWDASRAPDGRATAWAYCHVPAGSTLDMTAAIERQVERFAPGFRDRVLARSTMSPAQMEAHDPNYVGGDINAGLQDLRQLVFRPRLARDPYRIADGLYLCSSSTPPGGGVHGMSGLHAARSVLAHDLR
ncbi:MAG TPA: NAD(P)/FAD-dependent oxidoreductase, partial [Candidatus Saccharimonadales bacterium]|nr:NAD(P)/FAD-dependent oxidoreductase [Candidatus Saccharimonadales bacterium]